MTGSDLGPDHDRAVQSEEQTVCRCIPGTAGGTQQGRLAGTLGCRDGMQHRQHAGITVCASGQHSTHSRPHSTHRECTPRTAGHTLRRAGSTPRTAGNTLRRAGTSPRTAGYTLRRAGTTSRTAGYTLRRAGTTRTAGNTLRRADTTRARRDAPLRRVLAGMHVVY